MLHLRLATILAALLALMAVLSSCSSAPKAPIVWRYSTRVESNWERGKFRSTREWCRHKPDAKPDQPGECYTESCQGDRCRVAGDPEIRKGYDETRREEQKSERLRADELASRCETKKDWGACLERGSLQLDGEPEAERRRFIERVCRQPRVVCREAEISSEREMTREEQQLHREDKSRHSDDAMAQFFTRPAEEKLTAEDEAAFQALEKQSKRYGVRAKLDWQPAFGMNYGEEAELAPADFERVIWSSSRRATAWHPSEGTFERTLLIQEAVRRPKKKPGS